MTVSHFSSSKFTGPVIVNPMAVPRPEIRHVLFDFDGTLSLIREGWLEVMLGMFQEIMPVSAHSTAEDDRRLLLDDITRLTGRQTVYQMIQLAERVRERGGTPKDPLIYKREYLRRLDQKIQGRIESLREGRHEPDQWLVWGARAALENLRGRGLALYLASGTDEAAVKVEARLLNIETFFGSHIYGALDDYKRFSKKIIIERILKENNITGRELMGFGDGYVEIQNVKEAGGFAVAVATDEAHNGAGQMDPWKRDRLAKVGADIILPDFRDVTILLQQLFAETGVSKADQ